MQDFHYNYIKKKYVDKTELLLTDTNILMYEIKPENLYEDFYKDKELLDFINYPEDSKYYNNVNNLVVGTMNETCCIPIKGFAVLKSKLYTFIAKENHES